MIDGKQIKDGTITAAKLLSTFLSTILRADGSVTLTGPLNAGAQRLTNLGAPVSDTDAARLADLYAMAWKDKVVCATTVNHTLTGAAAAYDGITPVVGDRVLIRAQTLPAQNGIYIVPSSGTWNRSADADSASELRAAVVTVEQGTLYGDHRFAQTADTITLGTTGIVWVDIGTGTLAAFATALNKAMAASLTTADFQAASATTLAVTPSSDGYVRVSVNGVGYVVGDGVKTKDCYFSSDAGSTAKTIANIALGDTLYWVGSVSGFQLATTDVVDFEYDV